MTTKQNINFGEELIKGYDSNLETIQMLKNNKDDKATLEFLLEMQRLELTGKKEIAVARLADYKRKYVYEFEKDSMETNASIQHMVAMCKRVMDDAPEDIANKIKELISKFSNDAIWMELTQERRNEIYFKLKGHHEFLTKTYKANG